MDIHLDHASAETQPNLVSAEGDARGIRECQKHCVVNIRMKMTLIERKPPPTSLLGSLYLWFSTGPQGSHSEISVHTDSLLSGVAFMIEAVEFV